MRDHAEQVYSIRGLLHILKFKSLIATEQKQMHGIVKGFLCVLQTTLSWTTENSLLGLSLKLKGSGTV